MSQHYSRADREDDDYALPDVETFYLTGKDRDFVDDEGDPLEKGWYYWYCFPGCLPDSDPFGPYTTEAEAIEAARDDDGD